MFIPTESQFHVAIILIVFVWFFSFLCCIYFILDYSTNPKSNFKRIKSFFFFWPDVCHEETVSKCTAVLRPCWHTSLPKVTLDMCLILRLQHFRVITIIIWNSMLYHLSLSVLLPCWKAKLSKTPPPTLVLIDTQFENLTVLHSFIS